jgi:hypothetical protein
LERATKQKWKHGGDTQMQEKTAVLESTKGVERDRQYMRNVYNTLSKDNRKKLEVYAAALRRTQLAHEGAD